MFVSKTACSDNYLKIGVFNNYFNFNIKKTDELKTDFLRSTETAVFVASFQRKFI